jgi:DNA-binding FadR family transcriptional regulator
MQLTKLDSLFLRYIIDNKVPPGQRLPVLNDISAEMGISVGKLREEMEVARQMGLVSVRPRLGIQREPFEFSQMLRNGVLFGIATGEATFEQFSQLRQVVEVGFWDEAVRRLTPEDKEHLRQLVAQAWDKLRGEPIHLPNGEHRDLHLAIFGRLENPYVQGLLEAYWQAYEASEMTRFASYAYWLEVWTYHERIVDALCNNDFTLGQQLLVEHFSLLKSLSPTAPVVSPEHNQPFPTTKGEAHNG